jgi:hypothetical protein
VKDGKLVLVSGFPREVPRRTLYNHWLRICSKAPAGTFDEEQFRGGNGKTYTMFFFTGRSAANFTRWANDQNELLE